MSRFLDTLVAHCASGSPTRSDRGMTTGEPTQPRRVTWTEVHHKALRAAGYLVGTAAPGVQHGDAVAVLAGDPALIAPAVQGVWLAGGSVTAARSRAPFLIAASQCTADTDCKGDRVCHGGKCVDPQAAQPAAPPAPKAAVPTPGPAAAPLTRGS